MSHYSQPPSTTLFSTRLTPLFIFGLFVSIGGCSHSVQELIDPPKVEHVKIDKVRTIEQADLKSLSSVEPVTAESATKKRVEPPTPISKRKDPPQRLELEVAVVRAAALANNLDLHVELLRPSIAGEAASAEEARFDAAFFSTTTLVSNDPSGIPKGSGIDSFTISADSGVRLPLRTGGSAAVSVPITGAGTDTPGQRNTYESGVKFSISQPLLRNAGFATATAPVTIAQVQERQADARTKLSAIQILAGAETAFWSHYAAAKIVEIRYEQYQRALKQENQATRLANAGVLPLIEIKRAKAGVSRRIEAIIVAENQRRASERDLKRIMNMPDLPMQSATTLIPVSVPRPLHLVLNSAAMVEGAVKNRMEMVDLELQLAIDTITQDVTENQKLPLVNLDYAYNFLGQANSLPRSHAIARGGKFGNWQVGLTVDVPLGNRAAKARHRRSVLQRALTLASQEQRELLIEQQVLDSLDGLEQSWQRIIAARQETLLAADTYEAEIKQYQAGVRTSTDVLQAADFLADAQVREVQALASYEVSKVDIALSTGTLLGKGKIRLEPMRYEQLTNAHVSGMSSLQAATLARFDDSSTTPRAPIEVPEIRPATVMNKRAGLLDNSVAAIATTKGSESTTSTGKPQKPPLVGLISSTLADHDACSDWTGKALADGAKERAAIVKRCAKPTEAPATTSTRNIVSIEATPSLGPQRWLDGQAESGFTVQVLSGVSRESAVKFIERHDLRGKAGYFAARATNSKQPNKVHYGVVFGSFVSRGQANEAVRSVTAKLIAPDPWVRRISSIRKIRIEEADGEMIVQVGLGVNGKAKPLIAN